MANRKISEFTALTAPASGDVFAVLDVSASGAEVNKKITYANVLSKAPDGSAGSPAFSFNSDPNSGISGGSDTLVLSTGGTAAISVDSSQNVTLSANLTVSGTTTTIDTTTLTVKDKNIEIAKGNGNDAAVDGAGITIDSTDGDKTWNWVDSTDSWTSSEHIDLASGKVLKVAGTQVLSATNFTGTSAVATAVTVADESSDTSCNVLFATAATGNLAPKSGTNLTFNSDTGALTATSFVGALTGNVTGNASGSSGSCTGNAATATEATNVTVSANNSTDETVYPVFVDGATGTQGAETDTGLTYNPSTGLLTSTEFSGSGASLTALNASNLSSGTVNVARLGSGSSVTTKFLRGDNTWQTITSTPEGTAILSTGESGGSKYLREDGDGTCSWQAVPAGITINNNADNRVITGSGTANTLEGEASLTFDGTKTTTPIATVSNGIVETAITIATIHTITSNYNAMSAGPVTVSATFTVPSGSAWVIV